MYSPNDPSKNNTEWYVSEEPKVRLGKGIIGQIKYSPDGTQLAVGSSIGVWIYNAYTGKELNLLTGHIKWPSLIAYSPDGNLLASGGWTGHIGAVCLWNPNTGEHIITLDEHESFVTCLEFSPDGSILASGSLDETIQLWDVAAGKHKATLEGHTGGRELMVFSPDGRMIASTTDVRQRSINVDRTIKLWDVETGLSKVTLENLDSCIFRSIAFSPDGGMIASGSQDKVDDHSTHGTVHDPGPFSIRVDGSVQLWDVATGKHKMTLTEHRDAVFTVAYSPDGSSFISGSGDGTILLWDAKTYQLKAELTGDLYAITFSPDGKTLAIGSRDIKEIELWDAVSGEHKATLTEHTDDVYNLIFNPVDGRTFAGIGGDSTIRLWDAVTGEHLHTITGYTRSISSISFNADGSKLAIGSGHFDGTSSDKIIRIWNVDSCDLQSTSKVPLGRWVKHRRQLIDFVSYSPDGNTIASGSEDGTIRLWNAESGKLQSTVFDGLRGVRSEYSLGYSDNGLMLVYSPDGNTIASSSRYRFHEDNTIQLWYGITCEHKGILTTENLLRTLYSIAFSPDSRTVAGGDCDGTVYLWDATSGELKTTFRTKKFVFSVAFSPDRKTLASAAVSWGDGQVRLWDLASKECKATLSTDWVTSVAFSPDGSILAVGGSEHVTLWDVHKILHYSHNSTPIYTRATDEFDVTGRRKATLKGHTGFVSSVAFSPDGHTLASGGKDGTILLWDVTKTPPTPRQIAQHALSSTVVVTIGDGTYKRGQSNGFFIGQGLVATYTYLWALPAGCFAKLAGDWSPFAKNQFLKEGDTGYIVFDDNFHSFYKKEYKIISIDARQNLAILEVQDFKHNVNPLCLSDNDNIQIGDTVYVASNPSMFSQGIISSIFSRQDRKYFQITAPIPDGCNGSPVLNDKGQVIGVAAKNVRIPRHFQHQNNNFVVSSHHLRELLSKVEDSV